MRATIAREQSASGQREGECGWMISREEEEMVSGLTVRVPPADRGPGHFRDSWWLSGFGQLLVQREREFSTPACISHGFTPGARRGDTKLDKHPWETGDKKEPELRLQNRNRVLVKKVRREKKYKDRSWEKPTYWE